MTKHETIGFKYDNRRNVVAEIWDLAHANPNRVKVSMRDGSWEISYRASNGSNRIARHASSDEALGSLILIVGHRKPHSGQKPAKKVLNRRENAERRHASYNFRSNHLIGA